MALEHEMGAMTVESPGRGVGGELFLVFEAGGDRYALEAVLIEEVLPMVGLKRLPRAPEGVAGLVDHRGSPVPVVDLNWLLSGSASEPRLSTRIVLVKREGANAGAGLLGLMAERVTDTIRRKREDFVGSGVRTKETEFLGRVATDPLGMIQWIEPGRVLPEEVARALDAAIEDGHESR